MSGRLAAMNAGGVSAVTCRLVGVQIDQLGIGVVAEQDVAAAGVGDAGSFMEMTG